MTRTAAAAALPLAAYFATDPRPAAYVTVRKPVDGIATVVRRDTGDVIGTIEVDEHGDWYAFTPEHVALEGGFRKSDAAHRLIWHAVKGN